MNKGALKSLYSKHINKINETKLYDICIDYLDNEEFSKVEENQKCLKELCKKVIDKLVNETGDVIISNVLNSSCDEGKELNTFLSKNSSRKEEDETDDNKTASNSLSALVGKDLQDDDDADDEDVVPKKKPAVILCPVLRGFVKLKEGKLVWAGKWADSKEKFEAGERSKFKFTYAGDQKASLKNPPSGRYTGYFALKRAGTTDQFDKIPETKNMIEFKKIDGQKLLDVTGSGSNSFGQFKIEGKYDPGDGKMSVKKMYKPADEDFVGDDDDDDDDDGEIEDQDPDETARELADLKADAEEDIELIRKRLQNFERDEKSKKKQKTS